MDILFIPSAVIRPSRPRFLFPRRMSVSSATAVATLAATAAEVSMGMLNCL